LPPYAGRRSCVCHPAKVVVLCLSPRQGGGPVFVTQPGWLSCVCHPAQGGGPVTYDRIPRNR
ncbi:hypothetical protein KI387_014882, partial [Taxus chinensis]